MVFVFFLNKVKSSTKENKNEWYFFLFLIEQIYNHTEDRLRSSRYEVDSRSCRKRESIVCNLVCDNRLFGSFVLFTFIDWSYIGFNEWIDDDVRRCGCNGDDVELGNGGGQLVTGESSVDDFRSSGDIVVGGNLVGKW